MGTRGSRVDSRYKVKVQPTKTRNRQRRERISMPAPGPARPRRTPEPALRTTPHADGARGRCSQRDRGGPAPSPAPDRGPSPPRQAPPPAPGRRFQRKPFFWPLSLCTCPSLALFFFKKKNVYFCFFLQLFVGSLPGAGRSRGKSRARPTARLQSSGQDSLVHSQL